jgi:2-polyprenyl-3-methyl-5-hydroxy-6-metoxy-1,4-benzoquinol methylase
MARVPPPDPRATVRRGYDAVSHRYRGDDDEPVEYLPWLATLQQRLPPAARVLDLGCGCGVPVTRTLSAAGHRVVGVDVSRVQLDRARYLAPRATLIRADATRLAFPDTTFDAVVCLYVLIHLPLADQPRLLTRIGTWLKPGGVLLASTGAQAWTGTEDRWLGGDAPMWWSHADAATYRHWLVQAGLDVEAEQYVPEGDSGHQLFWTRRR